MSAQMDFEPAGELKIGQVGIANLGNSLAAVRKLVFDQGAIGQQQLAAALAEVARVARMSSAS